MTAAQRMAEALVDETADLGDEADCMRALMARGFGPVAIDLHLDDAIDRARAVLGERVMA